MVTNPSPMSQPSRSWTSSLVKRNSVWIIWPSASGGGSADYSAQAATSSLGAHTPPVTGFRQRVIRWPATLRDFIRLRVTLVE